LHREAVLKPTAYGSRRPIHDDFSKPLLEHWGMIDSGPLHHRLAIRALIADYAQAFTQEDDDHSTSLWIEDSTLCLPDFPGMEDVRGRTAILAACRETMSQLAPVNFTLVVEDIDVVGDRATSRTLICEEFLSPGGGCVQRFGRCHDELEMCEGLWKFKRRVYRVLHDDELPIARDALN
jgi:ketosteroid isomerase-like protein